VSPAAFCKTSIVANGAIHEDLKGARLDRLLQEPEGLEVVDGGKRFCHTAEGGERDGRCKVATLH
jgi:hypothetical protein